MLGWINKHKFILALIIFILAGLFYSAGLNNQLSLNEDDAIYIMMASSLVPSLAHNYTDPGIKAAINNYPYGYPAMLLPLIYFFSNSYFILRLLPFFLALMFVLFLFYAYKEFFKDEAALLILPLIALSPQIAYYSAELRSEIAYIFFSTLVIYLIQRYTQKQYPKNILYLLAAVTAIFISYSIRIVGLALAVSLPILFLARRELKKALVLTAIVSALIILWVIFNIFFRQLPYVSEFTVRTVSISGFIQRWFYNLAATIGKELPDLYSYPFLSTIDPHSGIFIFKFILGCGLALLIAIGFAVKIKKEGLGLIEVYSLIYFFIFCLSWTHHGGRYVMPILLFITYYLILGIKKLVPGKKSFCAVIAFLLLLNLAGDIRWLIVKRTCPFEPVEESFIQAAGWIKQNTLSSDIILSRRPNWLFVYTAGRRGRIFLRTKDIQVQYKYILGNGVDYVIIDQALIYRDNARDYLVPVVNAYQDNFEKVYESDIEPKTYIYRVIG